MAERIEQAIEQALFGGTVDAWMAFWANWWTAVRGASCIGLLGVGVKWMLETFDEGKVARLMRYAFLMWALATLAEGCRR
jgi:hypothetical protein